jgi:hypothetical protein
VRIDKVLSQTLLLDRHLEGFAQVQLKLGVVEHLHGDFFSGEKIAHEYSLFTHDRYNRTCRKQLSSAR